MARFFRWVPKQHAEDAIKRGLISHNGSALWIFDLSAPYRPGDSISSNAYLIAYDLDEVATLNVKTRRHIDFESPEFRGEGKHPTHTIVKNNENGAYGLGKTRQHCTNYHTKTGYATKKEVAKALRLKEIEISDKYRPPGGWPH